MGDTEGQGPRMHVCSQRIWLQEVRPPFVQVRRKREKKGGSAPGRRPHAAKVASLPHPASHATRTPETQRGNDLRGPGGPSRHGSRPLQPAPSRRRRGARGPTWSVRGAAAARWRGDCAGTARGVGGLAGWRARRTAGAPEGGAGQGRRSPASPHSPASPDPAPLARDARSVPRRAPPVPRPGSRPPPPYQPRVAQLRTGVGGGGRRAQDSPGRAARPSRSAQAPATFSASGKGARGHMPPSRQTENETALQQIEWKELCLFSLFFTLERSCKHCSFKNDLPREVWAHFCPGIIVSRWLLTWDFDFLYLHIVVLYTIAKVELLSTLLCLKLQRFYPDVSWSNAEDCLSGSRFIQFTASRKHLTTALDPAALLRAEEAGTPMCLLPELPQPIFLQLKTWKKEPRTSLYFCFGPSW
ncbi:PREDICTED: uncharacterized protein LOC108529883 [Rhinopithecus bieti]|uniref:uncharacterized protein LOC108529883 n=1 Tax=Rhinopithecus bieti TaxID=61621 RepID=UPI00083BE741|nr:PREDICTED: uncharacterized protein LOC108529883 [Rhinopithecus bieti]